MQTARDLMLLAAVAFKNGKFDDAGALFASSLSSEDADSFLNEVNRLGNPTAENLDIESVSSANMSLSQIAQSLSGAIKESVIEAGDEDEESEDEEEMEDEESEDEDEDEEEDSEDDESVSTSSSGIQRRSKSEPQLVISVANSPIKLRQ